MTKFPITLHGKDRGTMGHFGEDLRREREKRKITLEAIVSVTKIGTRHLIALEKNQFAELPGGVFNKGIVRSYARVVGLDEEVWVQRFMSEYQQSGQLKDDDAAWIGFAENVGKSRERDPGRQALQLRWAGVGMLLLLLAGLGWFVWRFVHEKLAAELTPPSRVVYLTRPGRMESLSVQPGLGSPAFGIRNSGIRG
jgi:cytoskeleton protein RodZ